MPFPSFNSVLLGTRPRLQNPCPRISLEPEAIVILAGGGRGKQDDHALRSQARPLRSIPGIGEAVILEVLVRLPQLQRCRNVRAWVAYAGVDPRAYESGTSIRGRAHLSKRGDATLRQILYMPSLSAMQYNPVIQAFAQRLRERGKNGKVIACAVMRKLLHLIYGVLNTQKPFDPQAHLQA